MVTTAGCDISLPPPPRGASEGRPPAPPRLEAGSLPTARSALGYRLRAPAESHVRAARHPVLSYPLAAAACARPGAPHPATPIASLLPVPPHPRAAAARRPCAAAP